MGAGLGVIGGPDNTRTAKSRNDGRVLTGNGLRARIAVGSLGSLSGRTSIAPLHKKNFRMALTPHLEGASCAYSAPSVLEPEACFRPFS